MAVDETAKQSILHSNFPICKSGGSSRLPVVSLSCRAKPS